MTDIVICRSGQRPEVLSVTDPSNDLNSLVPSFGTMSYPAYLGKGKDKGLKLVVDEDALSSGVPHNRWGIHGDFCVVKWAGNRKVPESLSPESIRRIIADLDEEYGVMDPRAGAGVIYALQVGAFGKSADEFVRDGGVWDPDFHWTGEHRQPEIKFINWLLLRYGRHIEAMHVGSMFGFDYSVEVQFGKSPTDRSMRDECRMKYAESFDEEGVLRREIVARPPRPWS